MSITPSASAVFASHNADMKRVFAVIWLEHEYEGGWGVSNDVSYMTLHTDKDDAIAYVSADLTQEYGQKAAQLLGAGDYFTYPAGPDKAFEIYEFELPVFAYEALEETKFKHPRTNMNVVAVNLTKPATELWRVLYASCQTPLETHLIDAPSLYPKPMTQLPKVFYPQASDSASDILNIIKRHLKPSG